MTQPSLNIDLFGTDAVLHHIGMVVASIERLHPDAVVTVDKTQKVKVAFVDLHGVIAELIEPLSDESPVYRQLQQGIKLPHLCYSVSSLETTLRHCRSKGCHAISKPTLATAFKQRIVWVFHKDYGLFELLERGQNA